MNKTFKRTKILATVGPAVDSQETIREMVKGGVNGYRLNFSHGDSEERDEFFNDSVYGYESIIKLYMGLKGVVDNANS